MNETCNCDYLERIKQLRQSTSNKLYGKNELNSYKKYNLINKSTEPYEFDLIKLERLYILFKYNMITCSKIFKPLWVSPSELIYATKGKIWDWNNEDEFNESLKSVRDCGLYFPIFTLDKGIPHNQIDIDDIGNKYNSYNGNHRVDIIQELNKRYGIYEKVLIYIIPEFCEKSCTGFRYSEIDFNKELPDLVKNHFIEEEIGSLKLFHLSYVEDEMKMYNLPTIEKNFYDGIDYVEVFDYQTAFRILQEFQNVLEVPLTYFYKINKKLPDNIDTKMFNNKEIFDLSLCQYKSTVDTCILLDKMRYETCSLMICCKYCYHREECLNKCKFI